MIQGGGTYTMPNEVTLDFNYDGGYHYVGAFMVTEEQHVLVLVPNGTGMDGVFFTQIQEG